MPFAALRIAVTTAASTVTVCVAITAAAATVTLLAGVTAAAAALAVIVALLAAAATALTVWAASTAIAALPLVSLASVPRAAIRLAVVRSSCRGEPLPRAPAPGALWLLARGRDRTLRGHVRPLAQAHFVRAGVSFATGQFTPCEHVGTTRAHRLAAPCENDLIALEPERFHLDDERVNPLGRIELVRVPVRLVVSRDLFGLLPHACLASWVVPGRRLSRNGARFRHGAARSVRASVTIHCTGTSPGWAGTSTTSWNSNATPTLTARIARGRTLS